MTARRCPNDILDSMSPAATSQHQSEASIVFSPNILLPVYHPNYLGRKNSTTLILRQGLSSADRNELRRLFRGCFAAAVAADFTVVVAGSSQSP
ncbi:unnamed protein product [Macrosiphum euphorbiae]|uniref:Uncharacterized protein n=1 Tax=Macrosiphum euphorbiae TaxID=13131 RepID=A0AAV0WX69_9HEMI|nr:unnamed protein product [Macrosiphum euphorbiae]